MGKKITLDFLRGYQLGTRRESDPVAYQYDEGHTLEVKVPTSVTTAEIQYWIRGMDKAEAYTPGEITAEEDGTYTITGNIPNSFFEHSGDLRVYVVVTDDSASVVTYEGYVHIVDRQMPEDYVDDDPENEATRVLIEAQEAAATATAAAETCEEVAESIPEDYSALSQDVTDLKADLNDLRALNAYNVLVDCTNAVIGSDITWTPVADGGVNVVGTSAGNNFYNYYVNTNELPSFLNNGETYLLDYTASVVELNVWFYKNGTYQGGTNFKSSGTFTVPLDATGAVIRLRVKSGETANETVYPIITHAMSNDDLTEAVNNLPTANNTHMRSVGNSILTGAVYTDAGVYDYLAKYDDATYAQIAKALNVPKNNVDHTLRSDAGLLAENSGHYNFLGTIKSGSLEGYDYLLTHFWVSDMNQYPIGSIDSTSGDGTLAGAVVELVNYINSSNGLCKLILVSVPPVATIQTGATAFTANFVNGSNLKQLDELMQKLAYKLHFIYIDWQSLAMAYHYDDYRCVSGNVHAGSPVTYRTMGEYLARRVTHDKTDILGDLQGFTDGGMITGSGNPIVLDGTKAGSIRQLVLTGSASGDTISVSGKNIYCTNSDMQARVNNGVRYDFTQNEITITSEGATANSVSSGNNFNEKYRYVNGVEWWHNYKFMFKNDTIVTVSLNASEEQIYDSKFQGQISDGTLDLLVDGNGLTFLASGGVEYGFRMVIFKDFSGTLTIKPQIEIGAVATAYEPFIGTRIAGTGDRTYNNIATLKARTNKTVAFVHSATASLDIITAGMNVQDKANYDKTAVDRFNVLTFSKTPFTRPRKPVITFIDDDTSSVALVQRYHDVFTPFGVPGGYAVMTKNLDEQSGLPDLLLQYEQEGFSCLYHCYYQAGDTTRYWESGNAMYDEDLIKENFMRGLRDMQEYGFSAYKYWVTPYGVADKFIQSLAKTHDMPCLFTMSGTITDNSFVNINGNCNRYNIPRISVSTTSNVERTQKIIDACVAANGWLTIVTHANTWGSDTTMDTKLANVIDYCLDAGAEIKSVPEAFNDFKPYFYWSELLA